MVATNWEAWDLVPCNLLDGNKGASNLLDCNLDFRDSPTYPISNPDGQNQKD